MFNYILLCTLLAHIIWAKPVHQHTELAPHLLIVTPQAELRLETLIPGTPILQHLSPFTRFIAPHEDTIVYVPTSAAASLQPLQYAEVVARSLPSSGARQDYNQIAGNAQEALTAGASQLQEALQSGFQNAGTLIAGSTSSFAPGGIDYSPVVEGLASAASAASAAAQTAGSSLAGAASFAPGGIDYSPVVEGLASAASAASAAAQTAGSSLAGAASFAPGGIDYSPVVQGLASAASAASAAAQSAGSSLAGAASFAPGGIDYSPVVQGLASAASAASAAAQTAGSSLAGAGSFAPGGIDYSPVVQGLASAASAASAAAQSAGSSLAGAASFAPGGIDYSPVVQGLASAASAASAAAQTAGSSLAGAASFAPSDPSGLVQGFIEQGPNALSSAATAATAAAASAGSSFVSGFTQAGSLSSSPTSGSQQQPSSLSSSSSDSLKPSPLPAPSVSAASDNSPILTNKLPLPVQKIEKIEYEIPITPILLNEPRHHYVISPAVPHIVDFVQGPILLAPSISSPKARSLQDVGEKEKPIITIPTPEIPKPQALSLANDLDKGELLKDIDEKEKKSEFKRFLEANALKEDLKPDALNLKDQIKPAEEQRIEKINLEKIELELKSVPLVDDEVDDKPQSKVA